MVTIDARTIQKEAGRRGWSQQDLARHAGLSRPTISVAWRGGLVSNRTAEALRVCFKKYPATLDGLVKAV